MSLDAMLLKSFPLEGGRVGMGVWRRRRLLRSRHPLSNPLPSKGRVFHREGVMR